MSAVNKDKIPQHIAIIMDGNGRWAKQQGEDRIFGHHEGVNSVREIVEAAAEVGVKYLTLYAFSTENWNRPKEEVDALMELLVATISMETPQLNKNGVKLEAIGNLKSLPINCFNELQESVTTTKNNTRLTIPLSPTPSLFKVNCSGRTIAFLPLTPSPNNCSNAGWRPVSTKLYSPNNAATYSFAG